MLRRMHKEVFGAGRRARDHICCTFHPNCGQNSLHSLFSFVDRSFVEALCRDFPGYSELVRHQAEEAIAHCFDLLGSGPVFVKHGMKCSGLEGFSYSKKEEVHFDRLGRWLNGRINRSNHNAATSIWKLVDESYLPIDWHIDFKSGYRWREDIWYRDIRFGELPGVDVKVPWELSRMQHLPNLALACHFSSIGRQGFRAPGDYAREFRNQILDFIATNPPRFGVNWACTMDVSIRLVNWLIAYDLVVTSGFVFDEQFDAIFLESVRVHARHVADNLEWSPTVRGNHYLANIVGLQIAAIYLPCDEETNAWLAFAVRELITEVAYQFHEDGANFEASVCYHRLSGEIVLWGAALLRNLSGEKRAALINYSPKEFFPAPPLRLGELQWYSVSSEQCDSPLPDWFWARLVKIGAFTVAMTRPDGLVVQFGDNDSGRFITLGSGEQLRANNDPSSPLWSLDHTSLVVGIRAVVGDDYSKLAGEQDPAACFLHCLAGKPREPVITNHRMNDEKASAGSMEGESIWVDFVERYDRCPSNSRWTSSYMASSPGILDGLQYQVFPDTGIYIIKSPRLYLAIRCGEIGLAGLGAHAHCDQLAIELVIDGQVHAKDPGSYIYTALPDRRNDYRSVKAHNVPRVENLEPADLTRGVFDLRDCAEGECLYFGPHGFIGTHRGYGILVYRVIELRQDSVVVHDFADGNALVCDPASVKLPFSQGYGRVMAAHVEK